jgi:hypothetical protein
MTITAFERQACKQAAASIHWQTLLSTASMEKSLKHHVFPGCKGVDQALSTVPAGKASELPFG